MTPTAPLRRFVYCLDGRRVPLNSSERAEMPGGYPYWGANGVVDQVGDCLFDEDLVLLGEDGAPFDDPMSTVAFGVSGPVWVNNHIHVLRPSPGVEARFLVYALNATDWMPYVSGSTRLKLTQDDMMRARIPDAPLPEQRAIADYLDTETARIDAIITKKRRMIELLEVRRSTAVERLLTGGLGGPTRPSRTGYFARVPEGWGETQLRHLRCAVQTGPFGSQLHAEEYVEGGWPVVNPANLKNGGIVPISNMSVSDGKRSELQRHVLRAGDIVFGRRGEMGRAGIVEEAESGWLCGTGSLRLRLNDDRLSPWFLKLLLETKALKRYFELNSVGSTMDNLNSDIVLGMPCLLPPIELQHTITELVGRANGEASTMIGLVRRQIDLLAEHRQALITAAVTGELRVPGVAA